MPLNLVLASASPRRRRLLEESGYTFEVAATDAPEESSGEDPAGCVIRNALAKNAACLPARGGCAVLSADTAVWRDGSMLGKPRDAAEAAGMLAFLSGRTHTVFTGVALSAPGLAAPVARVEASVVKFRDLSASDIDSYIRKVRPFDRAGAYDLSDFGEIVVESVTGSYTNVIGLPVESVRDMLSAVGIAPARRIPLEGSSADPALGLLRDAAIEAAGKAYAPFSKFRVGAAILSADGRVFTGCNVENSSFGLTNCAERTAVFKAVSEGARDFRAIAIAGGGDVPAYPCGACRQVLAEFCPPGLPVLCTTLDGSKSELLALGDLLPKGFAL